MASQESWHLRKSGDVKKALEITEQYRPYSLRNYGVIVLPAGKAIEMINEARENGVLILGIDGFFLKGNTIRPSLEHSIDYSTRGYFSQGDWAAAVDFVRLKSPLGLDFEVVLGDGIDVTEAH